VPRRPLSPDDVLSPQYRCQLATRCARGDRTDAFAS
jgi:hypothetical protein